MITRMTTTNSLVSGLIFDALLDEAFRRCSETLCGDYVRGWISMEIAVWRFRENLAEEQVSVDCGGALEAN